MQERRQQDRRCTHRIVRLERRHGERRMYQRGCKCVVCRGANAAYRRWHYRMRCQGMLPFGAVISPGPTRRLLRRFAVEQLTEAEITRRLGLRGTSLQLSADGITIAKAQRIQALFQFIMAEGPPEVPAA
jgi:hypothetical protein